MSDTAPAVRLAGPPPPVAAAAADQDGGVGAVGQITGGYAPAKGGQVVWPGGTASLGRNLSATRPPIRSRSTAGSRRAFSARFLLRVAASGSCGAAFAGTALPVFPVTSVAWQPGYSV